MDKGAKIKIAGCKVKGGLVPKKRIWGEEFVSRDVQLKKKCKCMVEG